MITSTRIHFAIFVCACALVGGCVSRPPLARQSFGLESPRVDPVAQRPVAGVVAVKAVEVAALYDSRALVYRLPNLEYERDPYADWLVLPSRMVEAAVAAGVRQSGLFSEVVERGSGLAPDYWLETHVDRLCGDFSQSGQAQSVVELQFRLVSRRREGQPVVLFRKEYISRIPVQRRTAAEVVSGCNRGVQQAIGQLIVDLQTLSTNRALSPTPQTGS